MADVVEINSLRDLQSYRMIWNSLLRQTPNASFYHTFDWLNIYWKHFGAGQRLRVLVIRASGTPIGILPLCVRTEQYRTGKVRVLNYPLADWGTWYGPIGPNPSATMFMAMQHLNSTPRDWDLMELRWTNAGRSDRGATERAMRVAGFHPKKSPYQAVSVIDMEGGWDKLCRIEDFQVAKYFELATSQHRKTGENRLHPLPSGRGRQRRRRSAMGSI